MRPDPDACRRCFGNGTTYYLDTNILCPDCLGTSARRPEAGNVIWIGGRPVGQLDWDDDDGTLIPVSRPGETLPPTMAAVLHAQAMRAEGVL